MWATEEDRGYIQAGPGNEEDVRFPCLLLSCPGRNGIKGTLLVVRQKSEPVDPPGVCVVLVALVQPEHMVARIDRVPPDCLQLCKKIKEVSGLVDDERGEYDALYRIA